MEKFKRASGPSIRRFVGPSVSDIYRICMTRPRFIQNAMRRNECLRKSLHDLECLRKSLYLMLYDLSQWIDLFGDLREHARGVMEGRNVRS